MDITKIHPELRKTYAKIPAIPFHRPVVRAIFSFLMGLAPNKPKSVPGVTVEDKRLKNCTVRIYRPENNANGAGVMWIHGGGYFMGHTGLNDRDCVELAKDLGLTVVSVDYRLAPKHPFPAAHEDCLEAWNFMHDSAGQLGLDTSRLAILGQSAGGGLAAGVVQRLIDTGGPLPAAQILMYPMIDDRTAANTELDEIKHRFFNNKNNRGGWGWYLNQAPGLDTVPPYAVPARREDLSGMPPTWICVGELDLFYNEDTTYAERIKATGTRCDLYIVEQAPHAFDAMVPESSVTRKTLENYYSFLREYLKF